MTEEQERIATEKRYELYDSAEMCAENAAPIFVANRWEWIHIGIPNKAEILKTLEYLERRAEGTQCESGRLIFYKGRYGHYRNYEL